MTARKPTRARQLGVTPEEYDRLLAGQDGHCAICPSTPKSRRLDTDHDHKTDQVRGLLCHRCNRALPNWITPAWLRSAADYLERTLTPPGECAWVWHRGDQVYYGCKHHPGHDGPHEPVYIAYMPPQSEWFVP